LIKVYVIRVLEIEFEDGEYKYHQLETNQRFGPFATVGSMTAHIHERMLEDIIEAITRQYN
jgi:hypothetical protein